MGVRERERERERESERVREGGRERERETTTVMAAVTIHLAYLVNGGSSSELLQQGPDEIGWILVLYEVHLTRAGVRRKLN